jgi:hypothetical protein
VDVPLGARVDRRHDHPLTHCSDLSKSVAGNAI